MTTRGCCVVGCMQEYHNRGFCSAHYTESHTCLVVGCPQTVYAKKLCSAHYCYQLRRNHTPPLRVPLVLMCREEGCPKPPKCHGWCDTHYNYHKRKDNLPVPVRRCSVAECDLPHSGKGFCIQHYSRLSRNGDPSTFVKIQHKTRDYGSGSINQDGYLVVQRVGHPNAESQGRIFEHRFLVSEFLGRPLLTDETVHHRNGNRTENTVGQCVTRSQCDCAGQRHNLELWSKSQPSGQRVSDKIQWAQEILSLYGGKNA